MLTSAAGLSGTKYEDLGPDLGDLREEPGQSRCAVGFPEGPALRPFPPAYGNSRSPDVRLAEAARGSASAFLGPSLFLPPSLPPFLPSFLPSFHTSLKIPYGGPRDDPSK